MRHLKRLASLPRQEQSLLLRALALVVVIRLGLWLLPFSVVQRLPSAKIRAAKTIHSVDQMVWAIKIASRCLPGATCLTQALAARVLLARFGYKSRVEIGVAKDEQGRFEAHAWLAVGEKVVICGPETNRYASLVVWDATH
jgi:hypothetical protein